MSLPALSSLNSNFTRMQNTKISASPNMLLLKKEKRKNTQPPCLIIYTRWNSDEVEARTAFFFIASLHPIQITFHPPTPFPALLRSYAALGSSGTWNAVDEQVAFTARGSSDAINWGFVAVRSCWLQIITDQNGQTKQTMGELLPRLHLICDQQSGFSSTQFLCLLVCPGTSLLRTFLVLHFSPQRWRWDDSAESTAFYQWSFSTSQKASG